MYAYLIRFSRAEEYCDNLIELPSLWRLLLWLVRNAHSCRMIHILRFVKGGQKCKTQN